MTGGVGATSLVGRDGEVKLLGDTIRAAAAGLGQVVLIEGEAGIGKTRLVGAACEQARDCTMDVFLGTCDDLAGAPFRALMDAFGIVGDTPDRERADIAALVEGHDAQSSSLATSTNLGLQHRVTEAFGALVEKLAVRRPLLLALEDLHWGDAATLVALRSIARRVSTLPVAVIASCRPGHGIAELHRITDDILRAGGHRLAVGPLDDASIASLVAEVLNELPSDALLTRVRGANGNPLFAIELVQSVRTTPSLDDAATPVEFRLTVLRRLATLPDATRNVLRMAAVLGATFSPADLAVVCRTSVVELATTLEPAVAASIIEDRAPRLTFRHALIRDSIYEHIPDAIRRELHGEVGRALADASSDALTVAHHLSLAAAGEDFEAVAWIRRAARDAAPRAPGVAVELLQRAEQLVGLASPVRNEVRAELAVALAWSGRLAEAEALSTDVLAGRPDARLAGSLRCGLVYALTWQGRPHEALLHATLEPDEELDEADAVLLEAEAAVASLWAFDFKNAGLLAGKAADAATRVGHDLALCHALTVQTLVANFAGKQHEAVVLGRKAVEIADRSAAGDAHLAHPRFFPGMPLLAIDEIEEAEHTLRTGLRIAEDLGLAWTFPLYHTFLGAKGYIAGDWDGAVAELDAALSTADEVGLHVGIIAAASAWLAIIQLRRDDIEAAERTLATALGRLAETGPQLGMGPFNWARAMVLEARNQPDEALELLQRAWDLFLAGSPTATETTAPRVTTDPWSAMAMVRLCVQTGDLSRAAALLPSIEHQAETIGTAFMHGQAVRSRGLIEDNPDVLLEAVALYRQCPRPDELASACEDTARVLASHARLDEAVPLWDEAIARFERLGAERDLARVRAQLREHGVARGSRRPNVRATTGWDSLTETERRVIALVVQPLSNPEVAERLFVSRHTVESHLKNIYRKLDLKSRVELAAVAAEHGHKGAPSA